MQLLTSLFIAKVAHPTTQIAREHWVKKHTDISPPCHVQHPKSKQFQARTLDTPNCAEQTIDVHTGLQFEVAVVDFVPRETLFIEFFHEGIGVEFLNVVHAWFLP